MVERHTETDRVGINATEAIFLKEFGWAFREQPISDYGIDAHVEVKRGAEFTGRLIALQIKTGPSYFKACKGGFRYSGKLRHLEYWTTHSLPVFLIIHIPETAQTFWQIIQRHLCKVNKSGWSIVVPDSNILTEGAKPNFEAAVARDAASIRRMNFAFNVANMKLFEDGPRYLRIIDNVNKTLGLRGFNLYSDPECTGEIETPWSGVAIPTHEVHGVMSHFFPWLRYGYVDVESHYNEFEDIRLRVWLRPAATAYLECEQFFERGPREFPPERPNVEEYYERDFDAEQLAEDRRSEAEELEGPDEEDD